ncbi:7-deoxyloganetin glucosyltransferase-like [Zingiber officinale]|uniref:Glycosyltransferase n=1 Tax=Zingiber officinale TaxID=94328 RepID=A0A8J5M7W3_ZINOF|nr:7-deoxyloganetin glucosyltransferase-like [Zingiber officinale]KAG6535682.1 hypothetical protein ZIOFF_000705 [Zingiber officinale]
MAKAKPHAVCVPFPSQGHINAMLNLAEALHFMGFHITFVNTDFNHRRILRSRGPASLAGLSDFRFASIPDGLSPSDDDTDKNQDLVALCLSIKRHSAAPLRDLINALDDPSSGGPRVTCVISDAFTSFTLAVTHELAIPNIFFCSVSACGFWGFFYFKELMQRGIIPLKSEEDFTNGFLEAVIDWIPGMSKMRLKDLPKPLQTTNPNDALLNHTKDEAQASLHASAVLFNTFHDLDGPVLNAMSSVLPPVYDIGPVSLLCQHIHDPNFLTSADDGANLWREDASCIEWLDEKEPGSVLYVNFGSLAVLTSEQLNEFAWGMAGSGYHFLWVLRPDIMGGDRAVLPPGFEDETNNRSFVTSWCQQEKVLCHAAVGGFLTHCGWNSTLESISAGVPMICWPFFGDQHPNCKYICSEWGIGMEIGEEVKREEVEMLIKELMGGQKGKEMRRKVLEWKERAVKAATPGGSSWRNLEKAVEDITMK